MDGWDRSLNLELPTDPVRFSELAGLPADAAAAVTRCAGGASSIVINPATADQPEAWLRATLVHEVVHAATGSACASTPNGQQWAVEGLAEAVAASADPATARANSGLVAATLARRGLPEELPAIVSDQTDYALAQVAAEQVQRQLGQAATAFFHRAMREQLTRAEERQVTGWYLAELRRRVGSDAVASEKGD